MSYNKQYSLRNPPPYPCIDVTLTNPRDPTNSFDLKEAMIDTGAGATCIPKSVVERLELIPIDVATVRDYQGNAEQKPVYHITISFGPFNFTIRAVETNGDILIGRNILNQLTSVLIGPTKRLEMRR